MEQRALVFPRLLTIAIAPVQEDVNKSDLKQLCAQYGEVVAVTVCRQESHSPHAGFLALVVMTREGNARQVVEHYTYNSCYTEYTFTLMERDRRIWVEPSLLSRLSNLRIAEDNSNNNNNNEKNGMIAALSELAETSSGSSNPAPTPAPRPPPPAVPLIAAVR